MKAARDGVVEVGRATREAIERAMAARVSPLELNVLLAVLHQISTYSWLSQPLGAGQLARIVYNRSDDPVGGQRERVSRALKRLGELGVLEVKPGRGRTAKTIVRLPTCSADDTITPHANVSPGEHVSDNRAPAEMDSCSADEGIVSHPRGNIEKVSEELFDPRAREAILVDDESMKIAVDRILASIVDFRITPGAGKVRNPTGYRRTVVAQVELLRGEVTRLKRMFWTAPDDVIGSAAQGEKEGLRNYPRSDPLVGAAS